MTPNSSFSAINPCLQLAVDSTSLGEAKTCFRRYYYSIRLGYQSRITSFHLTFGLLLHAAREQYYHSRATGLDHADSRDVALDWLLRATWNKGRPWSSGDPNKNRFTLIRSLIWYLDKYRDDPFKTVILANGRPAVELSFNFDSGFLASTGEPFLLCGHIDRLGEMQGIVYPMDLKTTKYTLDQKWFNHFTPDNQFSLYTLAGKIVYKIEMDHLVCDGAQILVGGTRFERGLVPRPPDVIVEWYRGTGRWLSWMNECAEEEWSLRQGDLTEASDVLAAEAWPMNDKSCSMYGGCAFRDVCARSPVARQGLLNSHFVRRTWDPLQARGDI